MSDVASNKTPALWEATLRTEHQRRGKLLTEILLPNKRVHIKLECTVFCIFIEEISLHDDVDRAYKIHEMDHYKYPAQRRCSR